MADDGATRTRRWKAHKQGDHHLCGPRCAALSAPAAVFVPGDAGEGPVDAQAALQRQARRLEAACDAEPGNAALERVLKDTLLALGATPGKADDGELAAFLAAIRS
jgi:hypothetical protein